MNLACLNVVLIVWLVVDKFLADAVDTSPLRRSTAAARVGKSSLCSFNRPPRMVAGRKRWMRQPQGSSTSANRKQAALHLQRRLFASTKKALY